VGRKEREAPQLIFISWLGLRGAGGSSRELTFMQVTAVVRFAVGSQINVVPVIDISARAR
jgi:hypothetical protein